MNKPIIFKAVGVAAAFFSALVMLSGCSNDNSVNDGGGIDPELDGSWVISANGVTQEFIFDNGDVETFVNGSAFQKGTYRTNGDKLTMTVTHVYGEGYMVDAIEARLGAEFGTAIDLGLEAKWYTVNEFFNKLKTTFKPIVTAEYGISDAEFERDWNREVEPMLRQTISAGQNVTYSVNGDNLTLSQDGGYMTLRRKTGAAYTVTFNANGGTVSPTSAATDADGKLASLPTPSREGYAFTGWYTAATGGSAVTASTAFSANTTIYARWEAGLPPTPDTYTITFNPGGGTVSPASARTGADGKLASLPTPAKGSYIFDGWFTAADGGKEVTADTEFDADASIYAHWTAPQLGGNEFIDERDGKIYKKTALGAQTWMAQNLAYDVPNNTADLCYENSAAKCAQYGRLYNWNTALTACPAGWKLPSDADWAALGDYAGGAAVTAGAKVKAVAGWDNNGNGTDDYDFSALPGGYGVSNDYGTIVFEVAGLGGFYWSATGNTDDSRLAWFRVMYSTSSQLHRETLHKTYLFSVRCVED